MFETHIYIYILITYSIGIRSLLPMVNTGNFSEGLQGSCLNTCLLSAKQVIYSNRSCPGATMGEMSLPK